MELPRGEYASTIMIPIKKDIFDNWIDRHMCGECRMMNKQTRSDKCVMPLLDEIFDALGQAKVFSTLGLKFGYHQLPSRDGDKVKMTFWGIDLHKNDYLCEWRFLPFGLNNVPKEF